jgi:hypothetical protein
MLYLGLDVTAHAEAGVWRFKVSTEKTWNIAEYKYDPGIKFGLGVPIHYDSEEGLKVPAGPLDRGETQLDAESMISSAADATTPHEREV